MRPGPPNVIAVMRPDLVTTLLLSTSLVLVGCVGSGHRSTHVSSPVGGLSGRGHAHRVSRHTPSDLDTVFASKPSAGPRRGALTARAAARTFLKGWLLYEYGHAGAAVMKDATPTFTAAIAGYPPDIPPTPTSRHLYGRLVSLAL